MTRKTLFAILQKNTIFGSIWTKISKDIHTLWWGIGPKKMRPKWVNWCSFEEEQWSRKDPRPQPVSSVTTPCPMSLGHIYQRWGTLICLAIKDQKTNTTIFNCVIIFSTDISCFRHQSRVWPPIWALLHCRHKLLQAGWMAAAPWPAALWDRISACAQLCLPYLTCRWER